jgi:hypothetical protein
MPGTNGRHLPEAATRSPVARGRHTRRYPHPSPSRTDTTVSTTQQNPRGPHLGGLHNSDGGQRVETSLPASCDAAQACACTPSAFGLSRRELRREIRRCHTAGWSLWELRHRFVNPSNVREHSA